MIKTLLDTVPEELHHIVWVDDRLIRPQQVLECRGSRGSRGQWRWRRCARCRLRQRCRLGYKHTP